MESASRSTAMTRNTPSRSREEAVVISGMPPCPRCSPPSGAAAPDTCADAVDEGPPVVVTSKVSDLGTSFDRTCAATTGDLGITATAPFAWTSGDELRLEGLLEIV